MAMRQPQHTESPWDSPYWPERLPDVSRWRLIYGEIADELVVRFPEIPRRGEIVVPICTPDEDYAGLLVAMDTGAVTGVHVYPLLALAVQRHPAWRAAAEPEPVPETAARIVREIRDLFDRFGIECDGNDDS